MTKPDRILMLTSLGFHQEWDNQLHTACFNQGTFGREERGKAREGDT
jgi:hypothetical protein